MKTYRVEFTIDVDAPTPEDAARHAWELLTAPDALLPVATVQQCTDIDLQALWEAEHPERTDRPEDPAGAALEKHLNSDPLGGDSIED